MDNIVNDISNAYHEGYERGRFDGVMDATDGLIVCKGYAVKAVILCKNCRYYPHWSDGRAIHICVRDNSVKYDEDFCSYGELNENM